MSQYFKIVLFYANLKGHPAYIMSHTSRQISKIAEPPSINIFETEDVALSDDYKSYIDNELTLAEWVSLKPPDFITFLRHHIAHNDNQRVT